MKSLSLFATLAVVFVVGVSASYDQTQINTNDVNVLQYALTLENLESAFYNQGQSIFTVVNFTQAGLSAADYAYFGVIAAHEAAHVTYLSNVISGLGSTPVTPCSYVFSPNPFTSVQAYVATALMLENTGTSAYDGAINLISNRDYIEAAATIATIEGRHAQYLYNLNANLTNQAPAFPVGTSDGFEPVLTPSQVATAVTAMLNGCQNKISLPIDTFVQANTKFTSPSGTQASSDTVNANDINTLQFALFLEHLEAAFYTQYQALYNSASFFTAVGYSANAYTYLNLIQAHETAHVTALSNAITGLKAIPVTACNYNFSGLVNSVQSYVNLAAMLEPVGTAAYDGAANTITSRTYLQIAATIATIEARHAAILAVIADQVTADPAMFSPFFNRTMFLEPALSPAAVLLKVTGLNVIMANSPSTCQIGTPGVPLPIIYTETSTYTTTTTTSSSSGAATTTASALLCALVLAVTALVM